MPSFRPFPLLLLAALTAAMAGGCASRKVDEQFDPKTANSRAVEQVRMRTATTEGLSARGAEIAVADPDKTFDPSTARFGRPASVEGKAANTNTFHFVDRTRTRGFVTREHQTESAWMGDAKFETKAAPVKESWFSRLTARTKNYDTKTAAMADKTAATRPLAEGDRAFAARGRRQAHFDSAGAAAQPMGGDRIGGESWSGDLKPMTIQDVKSLLNKN